MIEFKCESCNTVLSNKKNLERHKLSVHQKLENEQCDICGRKFSFIFEVRAHKQKVHDGMKRILNSSIDENSSKCEICEATFASRKYLIGHLKKIHETETRYNCPLCDKTFSNKSNMISHSQSAHENSNHQCKTCGKTFRTKLRLKIHSQRVHEKRKRIICKVCNYPFFSKANLERHFMTVHIKSNQKFKCDLCGINFGQKIYLFSHKRRVHEKVKCHSCKNCNKTFVTNYELGQHLKKVHKNENSEISFVKGFEKIQETKQEKSKNAMANIDSIDMTKKYQCQICKEEFDVALDLMKHVRQFHEKDKQPKRKTMSQRIEALPKIQQKNLLKCNLCGNTFSNFWNLQRHMKLIHNPANATKIENPENIALNSHSIFGDSLKKVIESFDEKSLNTNFTENNGIQRFFVK